MTRAAVFLFALALCGGAAQAASVPFVGCASDGQVGPVPPPKGNAREVALDARTASRFAFYKSDHDGGILAPRGWHCANLEGSSGWILFVSPRPITPADFLQTPLREMIGPFIQVSFDFGGTSGRFEAARIMARFFPEKRAFVRRVIAEKLEPPKAFPSGPYPKDKLLRRDKGVVEYLTPPNVEGLGTASRLKPDGEPIVSAAMLLKDDDPEWPSALTIAVRLPNDMSDMAPEILRQAERQYAGVKLPGGKRQDDGAP